MTSLRGSISLDVEVGVGRHAVRVAWWYDLAGENGVPWTGDAPCTGRRIRTAPGPTGSLRDVEADQVPEGRLVDALVPRGEEGRGTLR
jgi:hypothetical protein